MKIALCFLVILTTCLHTFGFSITYPRRSTPEMQEYYECFKNCTEKDKERFYVCVEGEEEEEHGIYGYETRCQFKCDNRGFKGEGEKDVEVECKPGYEPYCWNFECTPEEKTEKKGEQYCKGEMRFPTMCKLKCFLGEYKNGNYSC